MKDDLIDDSGFELGLPSPEEMLTRCALIIADHGLPRQIQGAELAELVRGRWPEIPVVITSG